MLKAILNISSDIWGQLGNFQAPSYFLKKLTIKISYVFPKKDIFFCIPKLKEFLIFFQKKFRRMKLSSLSLKKTKKFVCFSKKKFSPHFKMIADQAVK